MSSDSARRSSMDDGVGVVRKRANSTARYLKYYFGGLVVAVLIETIMFLMAYSGFHSAWGLLVMFSIWVVIAVALVVWFVIRDDAAHDEQDARKVPLSVSELFLFQEPVRDPSVPDVDAVAHRRHTRRVAHVRVVIVFLTAWMAGALIGLGACQYFEKYWHYTQPGSNSGSASTSSGSAGVRTSAAWGNVNADTDPTTMPGAKAIYFVADQVEPEARRGGAALSGATFYCVMPVYFPGDQAPAEVNYWAVGKGCCNLNAAGGQTQLTMNCDTTGRLGVVVDKTPYLAAVDWAKQHSGINQVNQNALFVQLISESAYERDKYMAKVTAWVLFGVLPVLWPAGLALVLLAKIILDSCGCNSKSDDVDACRCCS